MLKIVFENSPNRIISLSLSLSLSRPSLVLQSKEKADLSEEGRDGEGRGLLYKVKHLKSTHVVKVDKTITKYLTCTASKPTYLPYCREHRALPAPLHRSCSSSYFCIYALQQPEIPPPPIPPHHHHNHYHRLLFLLSI